MYIYLDKISTNHLKNLVENTSISPSKMGIRWKFTMHRTVVKQCNDSEYAEDKDVIKKNVD